MHQRTDALATARPWGVVVLGLVVILCLSTAAQSQQCFPPLPGHSFEWGDAPEGAQAYPDLGISGQFPTCLAGPAGCIQHALSPGGLPHNAFFGPNLDYEPDGNAGVCPPPQYENDECYGPLDGDAGLVLPTAFTFGPTGPPFSAVTCSGGVPQSLANICGTARWGTDIDILLTNNLGGFVGPPQIVYLNVLVDLNRSGTWDQMVPSSCGPNLQEHVTKNLPVPIGFSGLASQLPHADFQVSSDSGYVWVRFSLTPDPVMLPWDGSGFFEAGETEDYMLHITGNPTPAEYGDAPQGVLAYPPFPIVGQFPTCVQTGGYVVHPSSNGLQLGSGIDFEFDGNANACGFNVFDNDECFGGEAGLIVPRPYTILRQPGLVIAPCTPPGTDLGLQCTPIVWGTELDIAITNGLGSDAYLNFLADWDQNGRWSGGLIGCGPNLGRNGEHVLHNIRVVAGFSGLLSQLNPPARLKGHRGYVWTRFTLSVNPAPADWDGSGNMGEGETEDYLLHIGSDDATDLQAGPFGAIQLGEASPNPTRAWTRLDLALLVASDVGIEIYDIAGRRVRDLGVRSFGRGTGRIVWDGTNAGGRRAATGLYFMRVKVGDQVFKRRVLLVD